MMKNEKEGRSALAIWLMVIENVITIICYIYSFFLEANHILMFIRILGYSIIRDISTTNKWLSKNKDLINNMEPCKFQDFLC